MTWRAGGGRKVGGFKKKGVVLMTIHDHTGNMEITVQEDSDDEGCT